MSTLHEVLMMRDGLTDNQASELISEMRERVLQDMEDPEEVLYEIGLEPDYIFDLIG